MVEQDTHSETERWAFMPDRSRLWVYVAEQPLTADQQAFLRTELDGFVNSWQTHGKSLAAGYVLEHDHFILLAVDEAAQSASGCSIDSSVHALREAEKTLGISLFNRLLVAYRGQEKVAVVSLQKFEEKLKNGELSAETTIFDTTVATLGEWRSRGETAVENSWLQRFLP